jgi:hypothetical protein
METTDKIRAFVVYNLFTLELTDAAADAYWHFL